jgi:hypothetical protein
MGRYLVARSRVAKLAANDALLFMLSDLFLDIDRFRASLPRAAANSWSLLSGAVVDGIVHE